MKRLKLWIISLWLFIWYKPTYQLHKYTENYDGEIEEIKESRWYVKPRFISWVLIFPILLPFILLYGGLKMVFDYFKYITTFYSSWITKPKDISFVAKLDIVRILWK